MVISSLSLCDTSIILRVYATAVIAKKLLVAFATQTHELVGIPICSWVFLCLRRATNTLWDSICVFGDAVVDPVLAVWVLNVYFDGIFVGLDLDDSGDLDVVDAAQ